MAISMYRITDIKLGEEDSHGMKYKIVETTAGNFATRCCAYNQTIERISDIFRSDTGRNIEGPPIKIWTLMYDPEFKSRQKFLCVKQLKESCQTKEEFHGCNIFEEEIEFINKRLENFDKVVLINYLIPKSKWHMFDKEDIISMVACLCKTDSPHITIPISPSWNAEESLEIINRIKKKMKNEQDYFLLLHPHMNILDQKIIIESLKKDEKFRGIMMSCCTLFDVNNAIAYNQASKIIGNNRLFILVDVEDSMKQTKVPTVLISRLFNVDITCRAVKPYLSGDVFDSESKKRRELIRLYNSRFGALLNEKEQITLTSIPFNSVLSKFMSRITNDNLREITILFNFIALNNEGKTERALIDQDNYETFIRERSYLAGFVNQFFPNPSGKDIK
jgi:hypothetical protein